MTTPAQGRFSSAFSCARQIAGVMDTVVNSAVPRVFVVGTARSGKTTLLRELSTVLADHQIAIREFQPSLEISELSTAEVLVVDDLHLLDGHQLEQIAERCLDPSAALIVATRPWPRPDPLTTIWRLLERDVHRVVLGVVSRADALACLKAKGRSIADDCLTQILKLTGGISWLVTRALILHDARDCVGDPDHRALQQLLADEIAHQLTTTDDRLCRLLELVCVGAPIEMLCGVPTDSSTLDALIARGHAEGLLLRNGEVVPVVRSAVLGATPTHRLAELKASVNGPGDQHKPSESPQVLVQQAIDAWAAGDPDLAAVLVEQAQAGDDSFDSDLVTDLMAAIWAERGMPMISSESYLARPPTRAESKIRATIAHIAVGLPDRTQTDRPEQQTPTTLGIALRLFDEGLRDSIERQPPSSTMVTLVQASELYTAAKTTEPIAELPAVVAAAVAVGAGDLVTATSVIDAALHGDQGGSRARARLLGWRADLAIRSEQPQEAREALAEAEGLVSPNSTRTRFLLETARITLARRFEDRQSLEVAWENARTIQRTGDSSLYSLLCLSSLIDAGARLGKSQELATYLATGLEITTRLGHPPLWSNHLWWAGIKQGILLNKPASLAPYAQALVAAAPHSPVAAAMAQAGAAWMGVLGGKVELDAVEQSARSLATVGLAWDGARLAAHGSRRMSDDRRGAARLLACARELHPPEITRQSQPKPTQSADTSQHDKMQLSEREHDVAVLILEGKTYAEIGKAIFISPRTVEHHVASIRRRLDARSRSDLIAKLRLSLGIKGEDQ